MVPAGAEWKIKQCAAERLPGWVWVARQPRYGQLCSGRRWRRRRRRWGLTGPGEGIGVFTTSRVLVGLPMSKADSCTTLFVSAMLRELIFDVWRFGWGLLSLGINWGWVGVRVA